MTKARNASEATALSEKARQRGAEEMTTEHQPTPEEKAYGRFLEEKVDMLSGAARTILSEAEYASYTDCLIHNVCFHPEEYEEATEKMRLAATEITDRDLELLWRFWRLALAAAASIHPRDRTPAGFRQDAGDLHYYYGVLSGMVQEVVGEVLHQKEIAERQEKVAKRESEDFEDISF